MGLDIEDGTWHTLDWNLVRSTEDLIAIRAKQIARRDAIAEQAYQKARLSREQAITNFHKTYGKSFSFNGFEVGMWVLRHETWLQNQHGNQDRWRWAGPYIIHEKRDNDSYVLCELDGTVIRGHVTQHRLRLFFFRSEKQILKSVDSARAYFDIQHFEREEPERQVGRHPDANWDHYSFTDRARREFKGRHADWNRFEGFKIIYLPGEVHPIANKYLTYEPHWRGTLEEDPAYPSFQRWSVSLVNRVIEETVATNRITPVGTSLQFPLGFLQR
ncbi:hypothetical protein BJ165DRAFT_1353578 [Panaeolus papilionaceus]|nr:hypothetical protein BJ165DRAFT_1353578 [Panaeolus papilionaceus]